MEIQVINNESRYCRYLIPGLPQNKPYGMLGPAKDFGLMLSMKDYKFNNTALPGSIPDH